MSDKRQKIENIAICTALFVAMAAILGLAMYVLNKDIESVQLVNNEGRYMFMTPAGKKSPAKSSDYLSIKTKKPGGLLVEGNYWVNGSITEPKGGIFVYGPVSNPDTHMLTLAQLESEREFSEIVLVRIADHELYGPINRQFWTDLKTTATKSPTP